MKEREPLDIENKIYELAIDIFGFDYHKYRINTGRVLLGVLINPQLKKFEHLFGSFPDNFLVTINKQFHDTVSGYGVNIGASFHELEIQADVFLLNTNNLNDGVKGLSSLIIHELCHMVLISGEINNTNITIGSKDKYHGNKLYKQTDTINEGITRHTNDFCILLAAASEIAAQKYTLFNDRWDCINSAMRYDLMVNLRK